MISFFMARQTGLKSRDFPREWCELGGKCWRWRGLKLLNLASDAFMVWLDSNYPAYYNNVLFNDHLHMSQQFRRLHALENAEPKKIDEFCEGIGSIGEYPCTINMMILLAYKMCFVWKLIWSQSSKYSMANWFNLVGHDDAYAGTSLNNLESNGDLMGLKTHRPKTTMLESFEEPYNIIIHNQHDINMN